MATPKKVSEKKETSKKKESPENKDKKEQGAVKKTPDKKMTKYQQKLTDYYSDILAEAKKLEVKRVKVVVCSMCGEKKYAEEWYRSYSPAHMSTINDIGERHTMICKKCAKKLFQKCFDEVKPDYYTAFAHWCQLMDLYYDKDFVTEALEDIATNRYSIDIVSMYMNKMSMKRIIGASFWDSPMLGDSLQEYLVSDPAYLKAMVDENNVIEDYPPELANWDKESLENYDQVLEWYKYDPFIDEPLDDRKKLYYNLIGFSDPDIADDVGKANACIDMCRSLQRLDKLNKRRIRLENDEDSDIKEIQALASLQKQERESVQKYQKEWGFNARYSLNKQQGAGTLTGILKEMDDKMFEDSLPNAYDIKTSEAMIQAAEASWRGIFTQLNLSESEFSEIVKNQREEITKLRKDLEDTREKLRLLNVQTKREELEERLKKQGGDAE